MSVGYTAVSFDVTERKRAEEFQRALFEQAGEAILVVDGQSHRILDANARAWEIHGYTREEFLGLSVADLATPECLAAVGEIDRALVETGRYENDQHSHRRKDGTVFPCALNLRSVPLAGRRTTVCVCRDLTMERKADEYFRVLFERASDAVYLVEDETLRVVEGNEAACLLFGYSREELLRLRVPDLIPPEYHHRITGVRHSVQQGPGYLRDRRVYLRKDGSTVATDNAISRVQISGRTYFICSSRDLTEKERSARELEEAKAFLEHLQENASDGFALLDEKGIFVGVNQKLLEMSGRRREELLGTSYVDLSDPKELEGYRRAWDRQVKGERISMRTFLRRPSGPPLSVEVSSAAVVRGERTFVFAIIRDITDRVKAEEQLRQSREELERRVDARARELSDSEARFRAISQTVPVPVIIARLEDSRILYANPVCEAVFGMSPRDMVGRTALDFYFEPSDRPKLLGEFRGEGSVRDFELRVRRADGSPHWVSVSLASMTFQGEAAIIGAFADIHDRIEAESALRLSEERFRAITETTPLPVTITRPDGAIIYVNEAAARLFGVERMEALGRIAGDFYADPSDRPAIRDRVLREGGVAGYELRLRKADGTVFWTVV